ncbi:RNA polymerase recycling motor HelD [Pediococcus argentinicus]|uniref:RNA polymerase recycling motor HelD n=1 Tax=Pediococcus argentinicus TaxID=480391 RepID=UPI00338E99A5
MDSEQKQEQKRVDRVVEQIKTEQVHIEDLYAKAQQETKNVEKNYSQNAKVNMIEADDRIETAAEIQQQKGLVARTIENEAILNRQITALKELEKSPYFGRIDIKDQDESSSEPLYIGISSFADQNGNFLVYDWRAPISNIYYNGTLGKVSYDTPAGHMTTELVKKRQFVINDAKIVHMFDINETVGDELLQAALGEQNDEYMRNIVSTIQKEQNDIIRDTTSDLLVVQGVAGSGKTSAILQRIAYLLYHSRTSLNADEIVLFSPNRLYSRYISDVLPSLGERNMRQLTLSEFFSRRFEGLRVESLFDRYENDPKLDLQEQSLQDWQESAKCIHAIQEYVEQLSVADLKFNDINHQGEVFFAKEEIAAIFASFPTSISLPNRFVKTKNELIRRLQKRTLQEIKKDWVQERINQIGDEQYHNIVGRRHFKSYDEENRFIGSAIVKQSFQIIDDAIYNNYFIDAYQQYQDFWQWAKTPEGINEETWNNKIKNFVQNLEFHKLKLTDTAPLLMLRDLIVGSGVNRKFQYVFVDEMQDYSIAQMMYLKHAFPKAKFTLLGDSEQSLFKDVTAPQELLDHLEDALQVHKANLITLNRSYRSTAPITKFAAALLPDGDQIQAFSRDGAKPLVVESQSENFSSNLIQLCQTELDQNGSVAILTKNQTESIAVEKLLHKQFHPHLLNDGDLSLPKGLVILPIYLAKGLEFDSVIVYDTSDINYHNTKWRGTLYTMASRAMHQLSMISNGPMSHLILDLNSDLFEEKELPKKSLKQN